MAQDELEPTKWSWRKLVREFGEEAALGLLQYMKGFGEYDANITHYGDPVETPYTDIHDEAPLRIPMTPLSQQAVEVGVDIKEWRTKKVVVMDKGMPRSILST